MLMMFVYIVTQSRDYGAILSPDLTICLWMVGCSCLGLQIQKDVPSGELPNKLKAIVHKGID